MSIRAFLLAGPALVAGTAIGCASPARDNQASRDSGTAMADALPPEQRTVTLTLWPFHEIPWLSPGFGVPLPLGEVLVCVSRQRPLGGSWEDFVETEGPCTTTVEGEPFVLDGVPGLSELVVTATKDGYRPAAFAVTTGAWDLNVDAEYQATDYFTFSLWRADAAWQDLVDVPLDPLSGALFFYPFVLVAGAPNLFGHLGGVSVSLVPDAPTAPYYHLGGRPVAGTTSTVPGSLSMDKIDQVSGALFVNLPEGEYEMRADHPRAVCVTFGANNIPHFGFAGPRGSVRAPVLAGHVTAPIVAQCFCLDSRDVRYCASSGDAGLDAAAP